jgi:hypothetical protein
LKITSIWNSGGYINLHLGVMTKGGAHKYHFLNLGKSKNSIGKSTQLIQLFHLNILNFCIPFHDHP